MFKVGACSTHYAVQLIERVFLSSGKELGLKWHGFGLVSYVTHSGVSSAVRFSSLSCGPSDGHHHHMHMLKGLVFGCVEPRSSWLRLLSCLRRWQLSSQQQKEAGTRFFGGNIWLIHTECLPICVCHCIRHCDILQGLLLSHISSILLQVLHFTCHPHAGVSGGHSYLKQLQMSVYRHIKPTHW